jgi:TolB-like protein/AraC-like DNA-binding protein
MDSIFINKLREIVLANLSNEKFGVEDLADEAGMSRTNLYRRLKASKHKDISHFIREIRLQKAMEILQQNHYTAAQISFMVGFGSPAYFNKCFREYYGFPPGEVKKRVDKDMMDAGDNGKDQTDESSWNGNPDLNRSRGFRISFQMYKKSIITMGAVTLFITLLIVSGYVVIRSLDKKRMNESVHAEKYMVVLPFRNESPGPENDYVNSGVTSEIYAHLQKIPGIRLKSRTFTEQGWNREKDLQTFGRKLGVDYILEGSTRKVGDSIRITVQLSEVNSGTQVWADRYDGIYNDKVLAFQSEVAMEVASSLDLVLSGEEINKIRHQSTRDILAWDLVQRGVFLIGMSKYSGLNTDVDQALDFFNRAIEADPQYARVYYSKGWAYLMTFQLDSAMYYADKAIELDPDDYLGYKLKGNLYCMRGYLPHYPELAITYLSKALEMEPEDYFAIEELGKTYCLYTNDVKKGLTLLG